jgi:hypothetical protein
VDDPAEEYLQERTIGDLTTTVKTRRYGRYTDDVQSWMRVLADDPAKEYLHEKKHWRSKDLN